MTQFKVGDWVRSKSFENDGNEELLIKKLKVQQQVDFVHKYQEEWELWQPKEGEWCWFYSSYDSNPLLGKFERYDEYSKYYQLDISKYGKHSHPSNHRFNYCEPFIGELPSFIKDK